MYFPLLLLSTTLMLSGALWCDSAIQLKQSSHVIYDSFYGRFAVAVAQAPH